MKINSLKEQKHGFILEQTMLLRVPLLIGHRHLWNYDSSLFNNMNTIVPGRVGPNGMSWKIPVLSIWNWNWMQCLFFQHNNSNLCIGNLQVKELSLCNKLWFSNTDIYSTWWCKPLIFIPPDGVNLWYFKLRFFHLTEFIAWNI